MNRVLVRDKSIISGFTLTEVMVATTLSLMLCHILFAFIFMSNTHYHFISEYGALQENGRFAMKILSEQIKAHAYFGCIASQRVDAQNLPTSLRTLSVTEMKTNKTLVADSDILLLQGMAPVTADLLEARSNLRELRVSAPVHFSKKDHLMISDCEKIQFFHLADIRQTQDVVWLKSTMDLAPFKRGAQVAKFNKHIFFVAQTGRVNLLGQPIHALFFQDVRGNTQEIVEGIAKMNFRFRLKGHRFLNPQMISSWKKVTAVKTILELESRESVMDIASARSLTPSDKRLHKTIEFTVKLPIA